MPTSNTTKPEAAANVASYAGAQWSPRDLAWAAFIVLTIFLVGWPVAEPPLILDDLTQVKYLDRLSSSEILLAPDSLGLFRPAKNWIFAIFASGQQSGNLAWSLTGLSLHACSALLLGVLARRLDFTPMVGWMAALLWAMSPAAASVFAFYSAHNIALSTAALLGYILIADWAIPQAHGKHYPLQIIAALACLALALSAYEMAVTAPVILLAVLAYRDGFTLKRIRWQVPLMGFGIVCLYLLLRFFYQGSWIGNLPTFPPDTPRWAIALSAPRYLWWHFAAQFEIVPFGVVLTDNPVQHTAVNLICWGGLAALLWIAWRARIRTPLFTLGIATALFAAGPLMNFIPLGNGPLAAYYCYLPGMGLVMALAALLQGAIERNPKHMQQAKLLTIAVTVTITIGLGAALKGRVALWAEPELMHVRTVAAYPNAYISLATLLNTLTENGQYNEAQDAWEHLNHLAPWYATGRIRAMQFYEAIGRPLEALAILENSPPKAEENHQLIYQRGLLKERLGLSSAAASDYKRIADQMTEHEEVTLAALNSLAILRAKQQEYQEAALLFARALKLDPGNPTLEKNRKHAEALAVEKEELGESKNK